VARIRRHGRVAAASAGYRVKAAPFEYVRAESLEHACASLAEHGDDAKIIAGGQSLVPMMNMRLARPGVLVDIGPLRDLSYIRVERDAVAIGALTRHVELERTRDRRLALLARVAGLIGHYPIRTRGTFGGSLAHADAAAEWCMIALMQDAEVKAVSSRGARVISSNELFTGVFQTALAPDEIVTEVRLGLPPGRAAFREVVRRHGDFALVAAAANIALRDGVCSDARVVLGGVGPTVVRSHAAEAALLGTAWTPQAVRQAARAAAAATSPRGDIHASAKFRRHLVETLVERALRECAG